MRHCVLSWLLAFLGALPAAVAGTGGTAVTLATSGYLLDGEDQPVTDSLAITFRVFGSSSGGTPEWEGTCPSVAVKTGYYAATLGGAGCPGTGGTGDAVLDTNDLPAAAPRWLEVQVGTTIVAPRLSLGAVPVASRALDAETLRGLAPSAFAAASHAHPLADVTGLEGALSAKLSAEADPKVGSLIEGKLCAAASGKVVCLTDLPAGTGGGQATSGSAATSGTTATTACAPSTAGSFWYDTSVSVLKMCNGAEYVAVGSITAPPGAPGGLSAGGLDGGISLSWSAVSGASSYEVAYEAGSALTGAATYVPTGGTSTTIPSLTNNQAYTLAVRSVSGAWRSPLSAPVQATPMPLWNCTTVPAHPGCVSASQYATCAAIKADPTFNGSDGAYWLDGDGAGPRVPFQTWCDMTTENGAWTLIEMVGSTQPLDATYWVATARNPTALAQFDTTPNVSARLAAEDLNAVCRAGQGQVRTRYANNAAGYWLTDLFNASLVPTLDYAYMLRGDASYQMGFRGFGNGSTTVTSAGPWRRMNSYLSDNLVCTGINPYCGGAGTPYSAHGPICDSYGCNKPGQRIVNEHMWVAYNGNTGMPSTTWMVYGTYGSRWCR